MTTAPKLEPWPYPGFTLDQIDEAVLSNDNISVALSEAILEATKRARAAPSAGLREALVAPSFQPTHRHYKGALYQVICRAELESNLRPVVVYRDAEGRTWVRDSVEFFGTIEDGRLRFEVVKADG